jgi:hypothetical protein
MAMAAILKIPQVVSTFTHSALHSCELIFIVGLLWWPFLIQNGHQNTKILRFGAKFGFQVDYDVAN